MSQYKKGRRAEYYIKNKLEDFGHKVYRLPGSKPVDLLSFFRGITFVHEVKKGNWTDEDIDKLMREKEAIKDSCYTTVPVLWFKEDGKWQHTTFSSPEYLEKDGLP